MKIQMRCSQCTVLQRQNPHDVLLEDTRFTDEHGGTPTQDILQYPRFRHHAICFLFQLFLPPHLSLHFVFFIPSSRSFWFSNGLLFGCRLMPLRNTRKNIITDFRVPFWYRRRTGSMWTGTLHVLFAGRWWLSQNWVIAILHSRRSCDNKCAWRLLSKHRSKSF